MELLLFPKIKLVAGFDYNCYKETAEVGSIDGTIPTSVLFFMSTYYKSIDSSANCV